MQAYGRKTLAVNKSPDPIEGQVVADVCVIQQWPSQAAVEKWLNSAEYAPLKQLRDECAMEKLVMIPLSDVSLP
ncbi:DUF1330 domain-containing protein [Pseudoalteromonas rubra]|uniref:DUF1330 domain-containing protein n=1 Tax=Pseudoalteromonas rubra TaxID=43658 RepID=UPI0024B4B112|nr:DUF1330 domain-containing protein [Pseudoalteromonas rubra]